MRRGCQAASLRPAEGCGCGIAGRSATAVLARHASTGTVHRQCIDSARNATRLIDCKRLPKSRFALCGRKPHAYGGSNMARDIVFTPKAPQPPPAYSQAVKAAGLVFVSGTPPTDPVTGAFSG